MAAACGLFAQMPKRGLIKNIVLGETMDTLTWVYISSIDGKAYKADGSDRAKYALGMIYEGGAADDTSQVFMSGHNPYPAGGLNETYIYYLSAETPGTMTDVRPNNVGWYQALCVASSDSSIVIAPMPVQTNGVTAVNEITGSSPQTARLNVENLVEPSSPTSSYTIQIPAGAHDGDFVVLTFNSSITTVSVTSDLSIVGLALTTAVPGTSVTYKYFATPDKWIRTH